LLGRLLFSSIRASSRTAVPANRVWQFAKVAVQLLIGAVLPKFGRGMRTADAENSDGDERASQT
jgi:hypothetical protein